MSDDASTIAAPGGPAPPATSSATDLNGGEPLTYEAAVTRRDAMMQQAGFAQRLLDGDMTARREFNAVTAALAENAPDVSQFMRRASIDMSRSLLSESHIAEYVEQKGVPRAIRQEALALKASWQTDKAWLSRWLDGGVKEAKEFELLSIVLSQPVLDK